MIIYVAYIDDNRINVKKERKKSYVKRLEVKSIVSGTVGGR